MCSDAHRCRRGGTAELLGRSVFATKTRGPSRGDENSVVENAEGQTQPHIITAIPGMVSLTMLAGEQQKLRQHLQLQDEIWEEETDGFLESLDLGPGMRVLEFGCGYGFDLVRLARRVGPQGEVVGVEASPALLGESRSLLKRHGFKRTRLVLGDSAIDPVPEGPYDLIYCSWKTGGVQPAPLHPGGLRSLLQRFRSWLAPSGQVAFWEHHLEGLRMVPELPSLAQILRTLVHRSGGGPRTAHWLPGEFLSAGFLFERAYPRQKADPPGSTAYRWVEEALRQQAQVLLEEKALAEATWEAFLREWGGRSIDPKTLLFSPQVLGVVGRPIDAASGR